jgi:hypothetical protein
LISRLLMYISLLLRMLVFGVVDRGRGRLVLWVLVLRDLCAVFMSGRRADEVAIAGEV